MGEASLGLKISWFLFQKGLGVAKPEYLTMVRLGGDQWFELAQVLMKDNNQAGRMAILDQLLQQRNFKSNPKRSRMLNLLGQFLSKGLLDERRRVARYIESNVDLFTSSDEAIFGPLITAQRDKDPQTANAAETVVTKLRGGASPLDVDRRIR